MPQHFPPGLPRILIISPNWIGDAVMAQPLLQRLRAMYPDRPIDVLAPPPVAPVWRQMREVDEVIATTFRLAQCRCASAGAWHAN
jgi:heptosyltransferase-2